ncbi:MAG: universal stress protein [Bdellovibrionota bacterium]
MAAPVLVGDDLDRDLKSEPTAVTWLAADIAEALKTDLELLHVYKIPELTVPLNSLAMLERPYVLRLANALGDETLRLRQVKPKLRILPTVKRGDPVDVLLKEVVEGGCKVVVIGTHGRTGLRRAFLGSVAEEFIRRSPVPVLAVNSHVRLRDRGRFPTRILVALDLSDLSTLPAPLETAKEYASLFQVPMVLMHVVEEWVYPVVQSASLLAGGYIMPLERELQAHANDRYAQLRQLAGNLKSQGFAVEVRIVEHSKSPSQAIVEEAKNTSSDLIAIGHRHASKLEYALLGSVGRHVMRDAHCPVLVVPPKSGK